MLVDCFQSLDFRVVGLLGQVYSTLHCLNECDLYYESAPF